MNPINSFAKYITTKDLPPPNYSPNMLEGIGAFMMDGMAFSIRLITTRDNPVHARIGGIALGILSVVPTIIGIALYELGKRMRHEPFNKTASEVFQRTDETTIDEMLGCTQAFHTVAEKHGIKYTLDSGSLIGLQRHGGTIPWDDDVDSKIRKCDLEKLLACQPDLQTLGYKLIEQPGGLYQIKPLNPVRGTQSGHLDIFVCEQDSKGDWRTDNWWWRTQFNKERYLADDFNHLELVDFDGYKFYAIKNRDRFLKETYGENYMTHAYQTSRHGNWSLGPIKVSWTPVIIRHCIPVGDTAGKSAKMLFNEERNKQNA